MKINEDFRLLDQSENEDTIPIELLTDPYKGVIIRFTIVKLPEPGDSDMVMKFDFEIINPAKYDREVLKTNKHFISTIGSLLNLLILEVSQS